MTDKSMGNCPNCGAPITGKTCPYCSTVFDGLTPELAIGKVASISFEDSGVRYCFDMVIGDVDFKLEPAFVTLRNDLGYEKVLRTDTRGYAKFGGPIIPRGGRLVTAYDERGGSK